MAPALAHPEHFRPPQVFSTPDSAVPVCSQRVRWAVVLTLSFAIALPCLWTPHIIAMDLPSHLYNAWLSIHVDSGTAPGLYNVVQFTNVLFDHLVTAIYRIAGLWAAEHVGAMCAVLIFFWGAVAFVRQLCVSSLWVVAPCLSVVSYGAVFRLGFFNFYLSAGLAMLGFATACRSTVRMRLTALVLAALALMAHPVPVLWASAIWAYVWLQRRLPERQMFLLACSAIVVALTGRAAVTLFDCNPPLPITFGGPIRLVGLDQMIIYHRSYQVLAGAAMLLVVLRLAAVVVARGFRAWLSTVGAQLAILHAVAIALLPRGISLSPEAHPFTFIDFRLSLFACIILTSVLAAGEWRWTHRTLTITVCAVFFALSYIDDRRLSKLQDQVTAACQRLPRGSRVVWQIRQPDYRIPVLLHAVDEACVGYCYSYANYEPASGHFRIRARPTARITLTDIASIKRIEEHNYVIQPKDDPLYALTIDATSRSLVGLPLNTGQKVPTISATEGNWHD